jgi:hypothetical protein
VGSLRGIYWIFYTIYLNIWLTARLNIGCVFLIWMNTWLDGQIYRHNSLTKLHWNSPVSSDSKHVVRKTKPPHQASIYIGTLNIYKLKTTRILKKWAEASSETSVSTKEGVIFRKTVIFVVATGRLCSSTYKLNYTILHTTPRKWKITLPSDTPKYCVRTVCRIHSRQFVHTV